MQKITKHFPVKQNAGTWSRIEFQAQRRMNFVCIETRSFPEPRSETLAEWTCFVSFVKCSQRATSKYILQIAPVDIVGHLRCSQRKLQMGEHIFDVPSGPAKANNPHLFAIRQSRGDKLFYCACKPRRKE